MQRSWSLNSEWNQNVRSILVTINCLLAGAGLTFALSSHLDIEWLLVTLFDASLLTSRAAFVAALFFWSVT